MSSVRRSATQPGSNAVLQSCKSALQQQAVDSVIDAIESRSVSFRELVQYLKSTAHAEQVPFPSDRSFHELLRSRYFFRYFFEYSNNDDVRSDKSVRFLLKSLNSYSEMLKMNDVLVKRIIDRKFLIEHDIIQHFKSVLSNDQSAQDSKIQSVFELFEHPTILKSWHQVLNSQKSFELSKTVAKFALFSDSERRALFELIEESDSRLCRVCRLIDSHLENSQSFNDLKAWLLKKDRADALNI